MFAINFGFSFGAWWAVWPGAMYEQLGSIHFAKGYGIMIVMTGLPGTLLSASMFGFLRDLTGSYKVPSLGASGLLLSGALVVALVPSMASKPVVEIVVKKMLRIAKPERQFVKKMQTLVEVRGEEEEEEKGEEEEKECQAATDDDRPSQRALPHQGQ